MSEDKRKFVLIGASNIVNMLRDSKETNANKAVFLQMLFPEMSMALINLMVKYPQELRIHGAKMMFPDSWQELVKQHHDVNNTIMKPVTDLFTKGNSDG